MLIFVFSALIVLLDQFFKRWIVRVLPLGDTMDLIPGIINLRHVHNTGAAFGIFAGHRWLLAVIAFVACLILIFILLRYTEGFWGTLGLAAVLGGAVGNLIDRVLYGYVIDMFNPLFVNFAVFNIADIFITLGFITFCIHFISATVRQSREEKEGADGAEIGFDDDDYYDDESTDEEYADPYEEFELDENGEPISHDDYQDSQVVDTKPDFGDLAEYIGPTSDDAAYDGDAEPQVSSGSAPAWQEYYEPEQPESTETLDILSALESELDAGEDYDVDALLREYGFEDDKD